MGVGIGAVADKGIAVVHRLAIVHRAVHIHIAHFHRGRVPGGEGHIAPGQGDIQYTLVGRIQGAAVNHRPCRFQAAGGLRNRLGLRSPGNRHGLCHFHRGGRSPLAPQPQQQNTDLYHQRQNHQQPEDHPDAPGVACRLFLRGWLHRRFVGLRPFGCRRLGSYRRRDRRLHTRFFRRGMRCFLGCFGVDALPFQNFAGHFGRIPQLFRGLFFLFIARGVKVLLIVIQRLLPFAGGQGGQQFLQPGQIGILSHDSSPLNNLLIWLV